MAVLLTRLVADIPAGLPYATDSSPRRTPNSYSKPIDTENTEVGVADKALADRKSPASRGVDHSNATIEGGIETVKEPLMDMVTRLLVVYFDDCIVKRGQLPFPHSASREVQNVLNLINHPDFKRSHLEESLIKAAKLMEAQQGPAIEQLVARLPTSDDLPTTLTGIAREVFFVHASDGVFWARLIAMFVFAGRVAVQCVKTEAGNYVTAIAVCFQKFIKEYLQSSIERLGGWDAFVAYCDRADLRRVNASPSKGGSLRRFLTRLVTTASGDDDSEVDGPASPQPLTSKVGWFAAPIALGASALYDVIAGGSEF